MTTREAAEYLGVHPNTIRNWADDGRLRVIRTTGNQRRFDPDDLARHALAPGRSRPAFVPLEPHRERYLAALAESVSIASTHGDLGDVCRELARASGEALAAHSVDIFLLHEADDELEYLGGWFHEAARDPEPWPAGKRLPVASFPDWRAVRDGSDGVVVELSSSELSDEERASYAYWSEASVMSVPLRYEGRLIGILDCASHDPDRLFDQDDLSFARIVAAHAATALANARLVARERERAAQTGAALAERGRALEAEKERAADLQILVRSMAIMSGSLDTREAMLGVCEAVADGLDFAYATIYEWNRDAGTITALVSHIDESLAQVDRDYEGTVLYEDIEPTMAAVLRERRVFQSAAADRDPRLTEHERADAAYWQTRGLLYVPMVFKDAAVGLIEVSLEEAGRTFTPREITLMEAIAGQAAVALVNARLFAGERRQAADLARTAAVRETLVRFGAGLRARDTVRGVAAEVAGALRGLGLFDRTAVFVRDPRGRSYEVVETTGPARGCLGCALADESVEPLVRIQTGRGLRGMRAQANAERFVLAALDEHGARAGADPCFRAAAGRVIVASILDQQGESVGLVVALPSGSEAATVEEAASLLALVCDQAGIAIRAAHRLVDLQRNLDQAWIMNEILAAVGATLDVPEVLRITARGMRRVTECGQIGFWLFAEEGDRAEVTVLAGPDATMSPVIEAPFDANGAVWRALATSRTLLVAGATGDGAIAGMDEAASALIIPLLAEGRVVGAAVVGVDDPARFDDATVALFEQFVAPVGAALQNARLYERIRDLHLSNLQALSTALNVKDRYMQSHAPRVAAYVGLLCRRLGYPAEQIEQIEKAAYLHDIGRIGVPDDVLHKPAALTEREWALVRDHAPASADIIKPVFSGEIYLAVRHHHERFEGGGYPDGMLASELPRLVRILTIADAYDAMTTQRAFARSRLYPEAVAELRRCAGAQFDPELVGPFVDLLDDLGVRRTMARAAALEIRREVDWDAFAAGWGDRRAGEGGESLLDAAIERVRQTYPQVTRAFAAVPSERGYSLVAGTAADPALLPRRGDPVSIPDAAIDQTPGALAAANVLHVDASGCWMSGFEPVFDDVGRLLAVVEADVPVETGVRAGTVWGDVGERLDSILRQAAARMTRIEMAANTDGLTGLYNHRYFQERLEQEVARARQHDERLALLFGDLDHFKDFNDRVGHQAGDEALRRVAGILTSELRRVDIAVRYGGEEFAVILPDTGRWGAEEVAERVRHAVEDSAAESALTISIGTAVFPDDADSAAELVDRSDWAMYRAKRKGRNRVVTFSAEDAGHGLSDGQLSLGWVGEGREWTSGG